MVEQVPQQQTFDSVARHLRSQGRASVMPDRPEDGAYRGRDGCKCSAGCLIPDVMYSAEMEGRSVADDQPPGEALTRLGHDLYLVLQLQLLHDGLIETWSPIGISIGLKEIAYSFGLDPRAATEAL